MQGVIRRTGVEFAARPGRMARPLVKECRPIVSPKVQPPKPKRLTDEQAELAGEHWEKAMQLAKAHAKKHPRLDLDWESAAAVSLCDAASRFDLEHEVEFWTFASHRVKFSFLDLMRAERVKGYGRNWNFEDAPVIQSLDSRPPSQIRGTWRADKLTWHDFVPNDELPTGWELRSVDAIEAITRRLEWTYREVMILLYCYGFKMAKAGRVLGLSESRVSQIHTAAIDFLREALAS